MRSISIAEWEKIEREEHDQEYQDSQPYVMDVQQIISYEDYCYKSGCRHDRGHRTRKAFEAINLNELTHKTILDIGCGSGKYSVLFALLGAKTYGFDISPVGVTQAQALAKMNKVDHLCHFSVQNASKMSYANQYFDIVVLHEVFHHAIKYPNVKEEILRVLKPGGKVIMTESLYGNLLFNWGRSITMQGKEAKGDVILTLNDIETFSSGFSYSKIELMSLFFMGKRVFQNYTNWKPVQFLLYLIKKLDDALLMLFPFLRYYCGECVAVFIK